MSDTILIKHNWKYPGETFKAIERKDHGTFYYITECGKKFPVVEGTIVKQTPEGSSDSED